MAAARTWLDAAAAPRAGFIFPYGLPEEFLQRAPRAQHFSHPPRLRDAAVRNMGRIAVVDLADAAQPVIVQMIRHRLKITQRDSRVPIDPVMGAHEGPDQPGPRGSLVIDAVALRAAAAVIANIVGFVRGKTAQPIRDHQLARADIDDGFRLFTLKQRESQRHGKESGWVAVSDPRLPAHRSRRTDSRRCTRSGR